MPDRTQTPVREDFPLTGSWPVQADGSGASELARVWTGEGTRIPADVLRLLDSHSATRDFGVTRAYAAQRDRDLMLVGEADGATTVIGVEGRTDEGFGLDLGDHVELARMRMPHSDVPAHVDDLTQAVFGSTISEQPELAKLRYELLRATVDTLVEATERGAVQAMVLVHVFFTPGLDKRKVADNNADLHHFAALLGAEIPDSASDWAAGPFELPGHDRVPTGARLLLGKVTTNLSSLA